MVGGIAIIAIGIGVFVFLYGGNRFNSSSAVANNNLSVVAVPFTKIVQGDTSTIKNRVNYFINSSEQLNELWGMIDATSTPPKIDFKKEAVIAVFAGKQTVADYSIYVSKIIDSDTRMVYITLAKPDGKCAKKQSEVFPYEIITIPSTSLQLAHEDIQTTTNCPK